MTRFDPEFLDRMYNNRALVPEHGAHFKDWEQRSALARKSQPCQLDLPYGPGPLEKLDVFPAASGPAPVLVFIHGGYWRSLDKSQHSFLAPVFTREGACVVVPNYALCPAVTIPQIVMQTVAALAWTWRHIARFGGDPQRISVVGHSAGGHLAAMLLLCRWSDYAADLPSDLLGAAMSISGLYELEPVMHTPFVKPDLRLTPAQVRRASPALLPRPPGAELITVAGADESAEFLRQNQLIQDVWGRQSVPVCEAAPGLNHFSVLDALATPGHRFHELALSQL